MKTAVYKGSIEKKFLKAIFFLIFTVSVSGYFLFVGWYLYDQKTKNKELAQDITQVLSQDFVRLMLLDDLHTASDITTKLHSFPLLHQVVLYNTHQKKVFQYNPKKTLAQEKAFTTSTDLTYAGTLYGKLIFEFQVKSLQETLEENLPILIFFLLFFLFLSLVLAKVYAKHFSKPIVHMVDFLEKIDFHDNKKYYIEGAYDDEIGKLYEEINIMFSKMFDFIKQRDKAQQQLAIIMQYDSLTGLLNKNGFIESLDFLLHDRGKQWNLMFYIKITNLRNINHVYSYKHGDLLLQELAKTIKKEFKDATLQANPSIGDFILFYQNIHIKKHKALLKAQTIADTILALLSQPITIHNKIIKPELSIGIDLFNKEKDPLQIIKHTNIALEIARENNQKIVYFDKTNELKIKTVFNVYEDLLIALKEEQLELYYQFQYNKEKKIFGAEALIRWNHPKYGLLLPGKFIPIAEKTDLIIEIGNWVIESACKQLHIWNQTNQTKNLKISINISVKQFHQHNFITQLHTAISKYEVHPSQLKLELLESLFIENPEKVAHKMIELKKLGFQLSLDDFGTGFSSLQYIKNFPLDQIKIDQSFVLNMFHNKKDIQIIKSILYLASLLNMDVIAEGVEEKEHYEKLKELGCHYFQGYYFAKPQDITAVNSILMEQ